MNHCQNAVVARLYRLTPATQRREVVVVHSSNDSYLVDAFWCRTSSYDGGRMTSSVVSICGDCEAAAGLAAVPEPLRTTSVVVLGERSSGEPTTTSYGGGRSAAAVLAAPRGALLESCSRTSCRRLPLSRHARVRAWRSSSARCIAVSMMAMISTRPTVPPMMYAATTIISRKPYTSDCDKSMPIGHPATHTQDRQTPV